MPGPRSKVSPPSSSSSLEVVDAALDVVDSVLLSLSSDDVVVLWLVVLPSVVLPGSLEVVLLLLELPEEVVESLSSVESVLAVLLPTVLDSSVLLVSTSVMSNKSLTAELEAGLREECDT